MLKERIRESVCEHKDRLGVKGPVQSLVFSSLGRGESNEAVLVTINGWKNVVYKLNFRGIHGKRLKHEFRILSSLPKNMGPVPLFFDESRKILPVPYSVLSFVEGKKILRWARRHLAMHAEKLASLHEKRFAFCEVGGMMKREYDPEARLRDDMRILSGALSDAKVGRLLSCIESYVGAHEVLFDSLTRYPLVHGDACADNILFLRDGVRYIDWEYSGVRDGAEDLARLFYEDAACPPWMIRLRGERLNFFLEQYSRLRGDPTLPERVRFWNTYIRFTDFAYCRLMISKKVGNSTEKRQYVRISRQLERGLASLLGLKE